MKETRAHKRIRRAVESRGFTLEHLEWVPLSYDDGGWFGSTVEPIRPQTIPDNEFYGVNVESCLANIDWYLRPPEQCDCERPAWFAPFIPLKDVPHVGMHDQTCRWHIRYHLSWWNR